MSNEDLDLFDETRLRRVPVRLWKPSGVPARAWILFSVGFGGERSGYAYLGRAWAARGLATAVIEHVGSNMDVLRTLPGKTRQERNLEVTRRVGDPQELAARPRDVVFAHSQLAAAFPGLPLGLAGHSFGAYTVLASLGLATVPRLPKLDRPVPGVSSCLLASPQKPGLLFNERALSTVSLPTLVLTGTRDGPLSGEGDYRDRVGVYHKLPAELRNLVVLDGVEHMAFAGIGLGLGAQLSTIEKLTCQWWESTLWGGQGPSARAAAMKAAALPEAVKGEYR